MLSEKERMQEWIRHYNVCLLKVNALCAVLENDGPKMLSLVLRELKLERSEDLVKAISES